MTNSLKKLRTENAILHIILATIFFAIMNVTVKYLDQVPFFELVFFRALISVLLTLYFMKRQNVSLIPQNPKMMFARGVTGTISLVLFFYSLQNIPLATAVTLQHLAPIFTVVIGAYFLKEKATLIQWIFIITSFFGVLLVKGFDARVSWEQVVIGVSAALMSGLTYNLIRKMKDTEPPLRIVFYFPLITLVLVAPFTFHSFKMPTPAEWFLLIFLGLDTFVAQYYMTKAYQGKAPGYISIFNYLGVFFAAILGYFLFDEKLSLLAVIGILIIVLSVILSTLISYRIKNGKTTPPLAPPRL